MFSPPTRLGVSALPLWRWCPGGFLETYGSLVCFEATKKLTLTPMKEYLGRRIDELASQSEGKQAKGKEFFHIL